jgi:hypothetical protein
MARVRLVENTFVLASLMPFGFIPAKPLKCEKIVTFTVPPENWSVGCLFGLIVLVRKKVE